MGPSNSIEFILICNLEKDLTPSSVEEYIYKNTTILPQDFVFSRLLSLQKKGQIIYEFLENPNHKRKDCIIANLHHLAWCLKSSTLRNPLENLKVGKAEREEGELSPIRNLEENYFSASANTEEICIEKAGVEDDESGMLLEMEKVKIHKERCRFLIVFY